MGAGQRDLVLGRYDRHVNRALATLARLMAAPLEVRSEGSRLWDEEGREWLDCGGFGVFLLGHRHPKVVEAVRRQLDAHPLTTRLFLNPQLAEAAETLAGVTPSGLERVFLTNSGAEAVELGLKIARLAGRRRVVAMRGGFHGKTLGALSITGRPQYREPFAPLLPGVDFVSFGDQSALDEALAVDADQTVVVMEPVQAEGGVVVPPPGYLRYVSDRCRDRGALLMLDEIQTGLGRLGRWWGADVEAVRPDILLSGKVLGGGVMPVGAVITTPELFAPIDDDPLLHSSTFAGNPLASAAVTATIDVLRDEELVERSAELGDQVLGVVREALADVPPGVVLDVRGRGLLIGIELASGALATELLLGLVERRVVPSYSLNSHQVLRLTPPAVLSETDLAWLADAVRSAAEHVGRVAEELLPDPSPSYPSPSVRSSRLAHPSHPSRPSHAYLS
jgi:putrescine aminotransferase